jgi:GalNAc-alpha-(1->4)-GalNAc-alpha-(1->3)-diNAcBac-PP-undecaprenol alpha-1,4-N-acetyl-D-galactosaminyltransferase
MGSGGAEKVMASLANHLASRSHATLLITFDGPEFFSFYPLLESVGRVAFAPNPDAGLGRVLGWPGKFLALRRTLSGFSPDTVLSFLTPENLLNVLVGVARPWKTVISERSNPEMNPMGRLRRKMVRVIYPRADRLVVQTRRAASAYPWVHAAKVEVIPNPVFIPALEGAKAERAKVVLAVGRLGREKGFDILIKAFLRVSERFPEWTLWIAGDGPLRADLQGLSKRLGLEGRIRFLGKVSPIEPLYRQASVFALASRFEGFPNALCEAMAHGMAVTSTDCPYGPGEIIRDGEDGLLVPVEDVEALAGALSHLIRDQSVRASFGEAASRNIRCHEAEAMLEKWEKALLPDSSRKQ